MKQEMSSSMEYLSALLFISFVFTMIKVKRADVDTVVPSKQLVLLKLVWWILVF